MVWARDSEASEVGEVAVILIINAHYAVQFGGLPSSRGTYLEPFLTRLMRPLDSTSAIPLAASFFSATQRTFRTPRKATSMAARDKSRPPGCRSQRNAYRVTGNIIPRPRSRSRSHSAVPGACRGSRYSAPQGNYTLWEPTALSPSQSTGLRDVVAATLRVLLPPAFSGCFRRARVPQRPQTTPPRLPCTSGTLLSAFFLSPGPRSASLSLYSGQ